MSDRLQELLRQRALLHEHLAWLDREIANASSGRSEIGSAPPPPAPDPVTRATQQPLVVPTPPLPTPSYIASQGAAVLRRSESDPRAAPTEGGVPAADQILEQYRVTPKTMQTDVRKGCFMYFAVAMVLLVVGVLALYFILERAR